MKTAIITGASSGMGRIFAKEISRRYKNIEEIWVIARSEEKLKALKREMENKSVSIIPLDLTKKEDIEAYEEVLKKRKPDVCILVNSAGYGKTGSFDKISYEHNLGMVKLNCQALTEVTYLTLPFMRKGGQIIQLASAAAFVPQPDFAVYAASKAYVLSLSRALKYELADREISVTAVCPGPVQTEFLEQMDSCIVDKNTNTPSSKWIKKIKTFLTAKPEKVVKKAIKDSRKGKEKSVYGPVMPLFELLCKLVPHSILLKIMS